MLLFQLQMYSKWPPQHKMWLSGFDGERISGTFTAS